MELKTNFKISGLYQTKMIICILLSNCLGITNLDVAVTFSYDGGF